MAKLSPTAAHVHQLVTGIGPYDEIEQAHIIDVLTWIESGAPLYRTTPPDVPPKHLVSYFVLIDPEHKSLLLADHIKAQLWLPSGGHVEIDEDPKDTVVREIREELGQEAVFVRGNDRPFFITATKTVGLTAGHTDVSLWYLVRGSIHDRIQFDRREFTDIAWFSFIEVLESSPVIFDPNMHRFTHKLAKYLH